MTMTPPKEFSRMDRRQTIKWMLAVSASAMLLNRVTHGAPRVNGSPLPPLSPTPFRSHTHSFPLMSLPSYYRPAPSIPADAPPLAADLCIYGANAAGVMAAVQARRLGLSVILLNPATHVGGLTTGGLGYTDFGNKAAIGGLALEFYQQLGAHYGCETEYCFEPSAGEKTLLAFLAAAGVEPLHGHYLATATVEHGRLVGLATTSGLRVRARAFIDCSYEGDLMAAAGVSFTVGREANAAYGETYNGQQLHASHNFPYPVDPYVKPGNPASGLLPGIDPDDRFEPGAGDHRLQAFNFRLCLTREQSIRASFPRPEGYDRRDYELLARALASGFNQIFAKFDPIRGHKVDRNNHGPVSTDFIGQNWSWPTAGHAERDTLFADHLRWTMGLHWFYQHDEAVPAPVRARYAEWGLAADEFTDTGHWPHQLYIREGRRMVANAVMTEHHCMGREVADGIVGLGTYQMDSHNCRRFVRDGRVFNEGDVQILLPKPYGIGYRAIVPRRGECPNLAVPVALSASHIAYGSIRMEPVFMVLAQSAAIAVAHALRHNLALQDVPYAELKPQLLAAGQVVDWDAAQANPLHGNEADTTGRYDLPPERTVTW